MMSRDLPAVRSRRRTQWKCSQCGEWVDGALTAHSHPITEKSYRLDEVPRRPDDETREVPEDA